MYIIDRDIFTSKSKYSYKESDFVLCKTSCCDMFLVKDDELLDYYVNPNNLNKIVHFNENIECPFCNSIDCSINEVVNEFDIKSLETLWEKYYRNDILKEYISLSTNNERSTKLALFLIRLFDGFIKDIQISYFKDIKTNEINIHGLLAEFTEYFKAHASEMEENILTELFLKLEETFQFEDEVNNAVCTCFLENIAGEGFGKYINKYIGYKSDEYFQKWGG